MRFINLYEKEETKQNEESKITIDTILADLDGIYKDRSKYIKFLNNIYRPGQQPERSFTYGGNGRKNGEGGKSVSYTIDRNSKQPSDDFRKIMAKIKDGHPSWKKEIAACLDNIETAKQQEYIKSIFIPKLEDPGINLTSRSIKGYNDSRIADAQQYKKMGQAMVFYCGMCISKMADADTKIGTERFKEIMQGCFGSSPENNREDNDYLMQFMTLEPKMKIDAAKNVINSIRITGTNDIETNNSENESYYSGMSYVINLLFEADESNDSDIVACPKSIDEFSKNIRTALKQAEAVSKKYPKQYKLWYEKLRSAFEEGIEEYQKKERDPKLAETGIENPITGETVHRNGRAWGVGGPNAFIRNHKDLEAITEKIKKGTPGIEGVNGWDVFNFGPRLILAMFDAIEKGGQIYQKICDDLGEGIKQMKKSLGTLHARDFERLINQYAGENKHNDAMAISFAAVMTGIAGLYNILGNGSIGKINEKTKTFNSENINGQTKIQTRIDDLKISIARLIKEEEEFNNWIEEENNKKEKEKQKLEAEIKDQQNSQTPPQQNASYKPEISIKSLIKEAENKETKHQKSIEDKKKELEELDKNFHKKVSINISNYIAILDNYKLSVSLQPQIKKVYEYIRLLFNPDYAEEQYVARSNNKNNQNTQENPEEEYSNESLNICVNSIKLFENDETIDPNEEGDNDSTNNTVQNNTLKSDEPTYSKNEGNINWIKDGSGKGLKEIYRLFAEDDKNIRLDISKFTDLAKSKNLKADVNTLVNIFNNLFETLKHLDIKPITDGVVALNKVNMETFKKDQGAIAIVEFIKQEQNTNKEEKETKDTRYEQLIGFIGPDSNLMKRIVGRLNEVYRNAEDDSWLKIYKDFINEFNNYANEIYTFVNKNFKEKSFKTTFNDNFKKLAKYTFLTKIWGLISLVKALANTIKDLDVKKESVLIDDKTLLTEEHQILSVNAIIKSVNANTQDLNRTFLPLDYKNEIYDLKNPDKFNNLETTLAQRIMGTRKASGTGLLSMERQLLVPNLSTENNKPYNRFRETLNHNNCGKLVNLADMAVKSKDLKDENDRDVYLLLGITWGIKNCLNKYISGKDRKQDFSGKQGQGRETAEHKPFDEPAEQKEEAYISKYSKDSLINEIYKYIKG